MGTVLAFAGATHVGAVRSLNEDALLLGPPVFLVADGMGGHSRGEEASARVVEAFQPLVGAHLPVAAEVEQALTRARALVADIETNDPDDESDPGATMVSASYLVEGDRAYWLIAHVGDSRAYLWTSAGLEQVTRDHSVVQELLDAGQLSPEAAARHPDRHVITRAIGSRGNAEAAYSLVPLARGQRLLLCSDGLTGEVSDRAIAMILSHTPSCAQAVGDLVEAAVNMGGRDNVTVVVVDVVQLEQETPREDTIPLPRRPQA